MKFSQVAFGCALSILLSMPALATAATNPQMSGPSHPLKDMPPKNVQSFWIIKAIQHKLKSEGYNIGTIDGIWGKKTSEALKKYQTHYGLKASGKVNQETAYLLGLDYNEFTTFEEQVGSLPSYQNNS